MDHQRRGFFKSFSTPFIGNEEELFDPIRLPYNKDKSLFQKECVVCEDKPCIAVCDEEIIKVLDDGSVYLDFSKRGCTYCDECAKKCERGVLVLEEEPIRISAGITLDMAKCVAWQNVICSSCSDVCYDRAIKFLGMFRPEINYDNCTNCGFCIGVCPSLAISAISIREESS
jgi:ferredoxin-type protein NapF